MCVKPMLARIGTRELLDSEGFLYEPKVDGIRAICEKHDGIHVFNRSCRDVTGRYPEFDFGEAIKADSCLLDGEIVLYDRKGNPDFTAVMQRHLSVGPIRTLDRAIKYIVFDIIRKDGRDLTRLPLVERKEILRETVGKHPHLELVVFTRDGHRLWDFIVKRNAEGVIAKREESIYEIGRRSNHWMKIKFFNTLEAVIVGYTTERKPVSALALATFVNQKLRFVGKVGTGMGDKDVKTLRNILEPIRTEKPPCEYPSSYKEIKWVKPKYVCEIRYLEFGNQGMLRNPSFLRLRPDKDPSECQLEEQTALR
jgi:bifunctional non-homologous end joining protein LigD